MLKIYRYGDAFPEPCTLVLGAFDGLHAGHMTLIAAANKTGLPVLLTTIMGGKGSALFTQEERRIIFAEAVDAVYEIPFTDALKNTEAEDFLSKIFAQVNVRAVFCGEDFRFGKDARGTIQLLKEHAPCPVKALPILTSEGGKISASLVKQKLADGDLSAVNRILASDYFVQGIVEHGRQVGRTYGFPTLNLSVIAGKQLPKEGVYGGYAVTPKGTYKSIINIGPRPTFEVAERKIEAYLEGFSGDLYGETVLIYPTDFFREIVKFSSAEALKQQLKKDINRLH